MKTLLHKIAYFAVLMAFVLLMGERSVPHHHCGEGLACCNHQAGAIHFGYGECEECGHGECGHSHEGTDGGICCSESLLYFRMPGSDTQVEKKFIVFNGGCFILPEEIPFMAEQLCCCQSLPTPLEIPDIGIRYMPLRAPPVA